MVRQDKITYLITFFKSDKNSIFDQKSLDSWVSTYSSINNIQTILDEGYFQVDIINNRVLFRLGVISSFDLKKTEILLSRFIPFNRHKLLFVNIQKLGAKICTKFTPNCVECNFSNICDYFNEKNMWSK